MEDEYVQDRPFYEWCGFKHKTYGKSTGPVDPAMVDPMRDIASKVVNEYARISRSAWHRLTQPNRWQVKQAKARARKHNGP